MALFQNLQRGQVISTEAIAAALSAGAVVKLTSSGWNKADDETEAQGILMVDSVAAPTDETSMDNVYAGGVDRKSVV